jgi:hypothetical protein
LAQGLTAATHLISFEIGYHHNSERKESKAMDLKLTGLEASAVMNALQLYLKDLEKAGEEKGILIEKKTVKGLILRIEDMPSGEVP